MPPIAVTSWLVPSSLERKAIFPTEMAEPGDVIRIGTGFDAADLPFASIFGAAQMTRMNPLVFRHLQDRRVAA